MEITSVRLLHKEGGKTGTWNRVAEEAARNAADEAQPTSVQEDQA